MTGKKVQPLPQMVPTSPVAPVKHEKIQLPHVPCPLFAFFCKFPDSLLLEGEGACHVFSQITPTNFPIPVLSQVSGLVEALRSSFL